MNESIKMHSSNFSGKFWEIHLSNSCDVGKSVELSSVSFHQKDFQRNTQKVVLEEIHLRVLAA